MNQWMAGVIIVAMFLLHERVTDWIEIRKLRIAERKAENEYKRVEAEKERELWEKLRANDERKTAELRRQTAERIAQMTPEQVAAFERETKMQIQMQYGAPYNFATMAAMSYANQQLYSVLQAPLSQQIVWKW